MRTRARARIEEDIAALRAEVQALRRQRGAGLPDVDTLVEFIAAVFEGPRILEVARAADAQGLGALAEAVAGLQLAPAAEALQACVVTVFQAAGREDFLAYRRASHTLRQALLALLEARAPKWRQLQSARDLYPGSWRNAPDPAEQVRSAVAKLNRWEALVWAGQALACAREDVWLWWLWQTGWREHQEDWHRRHPQGTTQEAWQREIAKHTLPPEEARVVDSWPVPPDDHWPEGNTRQFTLPQLRKWQAKQGAPDGAPGETAEGSSAQ